MGNFYTDAIRKDARFASLQPIHDLALLEPVTRSKVKAISLFSAGLPRSTK